MWIASSGKGDHAPERGVRNASYSPQITVREVYHSWADCFFGLNENHNLLIVVHLL